MRLKGKVAIITGGASGIGRGCAVLFAREGAKVAVADINEKKGRGTVNIIKKNGGEAFFVKTDVTKASDVEEMIKTTLKNYRKIDILVNNAGISGPVGYIEDLSEEDWDKVITTNIKSNYLCSKYAIPYMLKNKRGGAIVNMSSGLGIVGDPRVPAYCASKGGIIALTKSMALRLAPHKIRVNCLLPAGTATPMLQQLFPTTSFKEVGKMNPSGRIGRPKDIAYAALYLASDEASWVTGATLAIDGGYTAQ